MTKQATRKCALKKMDICVNGKPEQLPDQLTLAQLIGQLKLQPKQVAIEVNRQLIPRDQHAQFQLSAGDDVEIVTLVGGG